MDSVGNDKTFSILFKQRLFDMYGQNWRARLANTSRGQYYLNITPHVNFLIASYSHFECVKSLTNMYPLIKLRTCSHRLGVESGRWHRPQPLPRGQRLCPTCGLLDDEFHFVFECVRHTDLRKQYIPKYYYVRSSMYKLSQLFNSNDIGKLAMFTRHALKQREA